MDRITEAISAISIGIVVAEFLRKTGPELQATEIYKEFLILLHSQARAIDSSLANFTFRAIYKKLYNKLSYARILTGSHL